MTISSGDIVEVTLVGDINLTEALENVFQFQVLLSGSQSTQDTIDDILVIMDALVLIIRGLAQAISVWRGIRVRNITENEVYGFHPFATPIAGNATGESNAFGVCALAYFPTLTPRVVGKKYFGVLAENQIGAGGVLTGPAMTRVSDAITHLITLPSEGLTTLVYGRLSTALGTFVAFNVGVASPVPAYQRRRRQGRGA